VVRVRMVMSPRYDTGDEYGFVVVNLSRGEAKGQVGRDEETGKRPASRPQPSFPLSRVPPGSASVTRSPAGRGSTQVFLDGTYAIPTPFASNERHGPVGAVLEVAMPGLGRVVAESFFVELDAESRLVRHGEVAVFHHQRLLQQILPGCCVVRGVLQDQE